MAITLQFNQKVLLHCQPKDLAGNNIPVSQVEGFRCESDYPPVMTIEAGPDAASFYAVAQLAGASAARFRGADGGVDIPDAVIQVNVVGPATSFEVTADAPVPK